MDCRVSQIGLIYYNNSGPFRTLYYFCSAKNNCLSILNKKLNKIAYFEGYNQHRVRYVDSTGLDQRVRVARAWESNYHVWICGDHKIGLLKRFPNPKNTVAAADIKAFTVASFWYDSAIDQLEIIDEARWNLQWLGLEQTLSLFSEDLGTRKLEDLDSKVNLLAAFLSRT